MAEKLPVLFMDMKTPGNFKGKRQQQEVRALALRAASFARPNRRKKNEKLVSENSASTPSQETIASSRERAPLSGIRSERHDKSQNLGEVLYCFFCGKTVEKGRSDTAQISGTVKSGAPWHHICYRQALANSSTAAATPSTVRVPSSIGSCDPFDSTPVPVTAETHKILTYVRSFTFTINWPDELSECCEGGSLYEAHQSLYRKYFEHVAPMSGMLCYVYNLMALAQPERAVYYRQKSMEYSLQSFKGLRDLLEPSSHSDEQLMVILQTTWPLASAEYSESVRSGGDRSFEHRCALRRLIKLLGGLRRLPVIYRELFVHFFAKVAIVTNTHTEIDPAEWDPGWWPQANIDPTLSRPSAAATTTQPSVSTPSALPEILEALRELVAVEHTKRHGNWSSEDHLGPVFRWTYLRRIALKMRLWNLLHPPPAGNNDASSDAAHHPHYLSLGYAPLTSLEPCLCLAAQLFIYLSLETYPVRQPWYSAPAQHAEMLARVKSFDCVLLRSCGDFERAMSALEEPIHGELLAEQSQAQDLLWIVAVGACFEDEMCKQQNRIQISDVTQIATAAGFWGQGQCQALQLNNGAQQIDATGESTGPTIWFSDCIGSLVRRLGLTSLAEATRLLTKNYAYDGMIMDETLQRLFDAESS